MKARLGPVPSCVSTAWFVICGWSLSNKLCYLGWCTAKIETIVNNAVVGVELLLKFDEYCCHKCCVAAGV